MQKSSRSLGMPLLFLAIGLYYLISLQRDYQQISRLTIYVVLLIPVLILFPIVYEWYENLDADVRARRSHKMFDWLNRSLKQNLVQYILMFCLPFFTRSEQWVYLVGTIAFLSSTLWDPWWNRLLNYWFYRRALQSWTLLCAMSFLFPFVLPDRIGFFYLGLALAGGLPFVPLRLGRTYLALNALGFSAVLFVTTLLPLPWRFPLLSVWLHEAHFEMDTGRDIPMPLPSSISRDDVSKLLADGHSLCCFAPIVAPPKLTEKIHQEWTLDGRILERPELQTSISGNAYQKAFRSFFCKQNFPDLSDADNLRCRLYLQDSIYLGEVRLKLK